MDLVNLKHFFKNDWEGEGGGLPDAGYLWEEPCQSRFFSVLVVLCTQVNMMFVMLF